MVSVALGKRRGRKVRGNSSIIGVALSGRRVEDVKRSFAEKEPDPVDELCQSLFARVTEAVIGHQTEDWPGYYDRLGGVVCLVIAQSDLATESKAVLRRRLIQHVLELEKWWPPSNQGTRAHQLHEGRS